MKTNDFSQLGALMEASRSQSPVTQSKYLQVKKSGSKQNQTAKHVQQRKNAVDTMSKEFANSKSETKETDDLLLQRSIRVVCYNITATISKLSNYDVLLPVLRRAKENRGTEATDIAAHLFGEEKSRKIVGSRLLTMCESLGLLEIEKDEKGPHYYLTDSGSRALESGKMMIPEYGTWTIWASNDPLLNYPILMIEPFDDISAHDELNLEKNNTEQRNKIFKNVPSWLEKACKVEAMPAAIGKEPIQIDRIEGTAEEVKFKGNLTLCWEPDPGNLRLTGEINQTPVDSSPIAPEVSFTAVWNELLENKGIREQWHESKHRLTVSFASTDSGERSCMERKLEFSKPHCQQYGDFETTSKTVPIFPQTGDDAQQWADWKLFNQVNTFATEAQFSTWCQIALQPFEEFSQQIKLPTRKELAEKQWQNRDSDKNTSTRWHLMATEDWGI